MSGFRTPRLVRPTVHLAAEHMRVLRRRARVHHLQIVLRAELQEALQARAGALRTLPLGSRAATAKPARSAGPIWIPRRR